MSSSSSNQQDKGCSKSSTESKSKDDLSTSDNSTQEAQKNFGFKTLKHSSSDNALNRDKQQSRSEFTKKRFFTPNSNIQKKGRSDSRKILRDRKSNMKKYRPSDSRRRSDARNSDGKKNKSPDSTQKMRSESLNFEDFKNLRTKSEKILRDKTLSPKTRLKDFREKDRE